MTDSTGKGRGAGSPRWRVEVVIDLLSDPGGVISPGGREPLAASKLRWLTPLVTFSVADRFKESGTVCGAERGLGEDCGCVIARGETARGVGVCPSREFDA